MTNEKKLDSIVELIAYAISADHQLSKPIKGRGDRVLKLISDELKLANMRPKHCYSLDLTDPDRLYSTCPSVLLRPPQETIGDKAEILLIDHENEKAIWQGARVARRVPRGVAFVSPPSVVYELHSRFIFASGRGHYENSIVGLDKNGYPIPVNLRGVMQNGERTGGDMAIIASIKEEVDRADAMRASVTDAITLTFPVPFADYQNVFSGRAGPLGMKGRRRPILHWVAHHLRQSHKGTEHSVKEHARGIDSFEMEGLSISISHPNSQG